MMYAKWGSAEGYLKQECGLNDDDIQRLRNRMITDEDEDKITETGAPPGPVL